MIKAKIYGACGYGGVGMIELLIGHPKAEIVKLIDLENTGMPISSVYRHLTGFCEIKIVSPEDDDPADGCGNSVFFATPDGVAMRQAGKYFKNGYKIVDYSGDFRFSSLNGYAAYAKRIGRPASHAAPDLLEHAVYGLTELNRPAISRSNLVGNPGCFAIVTILAFAPLVKEKAIDIKRLICDAKTGVSGAGKKPSPAFHYPARYENMNPYKTGMHQHCIEIENQLSIIAGSECLITLNTQVVPLTRGIMVCAYGQLDEGWRLTRVYDLYKDFYKNERFLRILPPDQPPSSMDVRGGNFCLMSVYIDARTGTCIVLGQIDNLVKGQAGSALQNMNLMHGLDESLGLYRPSMVP
ncbi:N-acetyl-gamma-glutamyl-phosphate reductase [bacterium]|nr:N-acetyl-gamma-glutamyl-phosphate reductase [bacterium]